MKDLLEIGKTVGEMVSAFIDGSEGKTRTRILTLSTMEAVLPAAGKSSENIFKQMLYRKKCSQS